MSTGQNDERMHLHEKRVCLLTGASGTLGNAFCRQNAEKYHIVAVYRRKSPMVPSQYQWYIDPHDPKATIPENEHPVFAIKADLTDDRELTRIVELVLARFNRVDLLINAAVHSVWAPMVESERLLQSLETQFRVNTLIPFKLAVLLAQSFWRDRDHENEQLNRNVINVSSTAGLHLYPNLGQSVYSASKSALNQLTLHMASEFRAFGIRVNALAPNSFPRIITTESVVRALVHLDEGEMTGKILALDKDVEHFM